MERYVLLSNLQKTFWAKFNSILISKTNFVTTIINIQRTEITLDRILVLGADTILSPLLIYFSRDQLLQLYY